MTYGEEGDRRKNGARQQRGRDARNRRDRSDYGGYEIDLSVSRAPRAFRDRQNLWRRDLRRLYRLLKTQIEVIEAADHRKSASDVRREPDAPLPHLAIAIFGPPGSGKSSLLRTLVDDVRRPEKDSILEKTTHKASRVASLDVMDPTTWRRTDQFLYAFLAAALEAERENQDRQHHRHPQGLSPVQLAFQEVNEYLRVLDEPEESQEYDPLGLSLQKLERHTSGLRLRGALKTFINKLGDELRSEILILPVDDLDMAPDHLVDSLRTYQSYLTHPRLVPVFTFTDRMAEELIEVEYRNQLKNGAYIPPSTSQVLPISAKMAVQFLARCFPVRNRIRLGPAPARVQRAEVVDDKKSDDPCETAKGYDVFELLITSSFLLFGHPDKEDNHSVKAALRPSTLRRQFLVVDAMVDSRVEALRSPQLGTMANVRAKEIRQISSHGKSFVFESEDEAKEWMERNPKAPKIRQYWVANPHGPQGREHPARPGDPPLNEDSPVDATFRGFHILACHLLELNIDATWATLFNGATWSLLNVHRDILRELGLFLEELYSWNPRELRTVIVEKILAQDQVTRRTVLDRWFNRTDYRRSQVLSLLAANCFRPWMPGEEPYGDREGPVLKQRKRERGEGASELALDREQDKKLCCGEVIELGKAAELSRDIARRVGFPSVKGLLWFINVTVGFYLPLILARGWSSTVSEDRPVRAQMSGNGWDLSHGPINAVRVADLKHEISAFGILFLDPKKYGESLRKIPKSGGDEKTRKAHYDHLLLRIWTCCGFSQGRYWAAFALWRGLGFIGQVLELGLTELHKLDGTKREELIESAKNWNLSGSQTGWSPSEPPLIKIHRDLQRLIRSHCLNGLASDAMRSETSDDKAFRISFPRWEPRDKKMSEAIALLAGQLLCWLLRNWMDIVYPIPGGKAWIGWRDCFIRRIHGDAVLGGLWPRLNATYLEDQHPLDDDPPSNTAPWEASTAAGAWADALLEYWRGCPPILKLLLTCPAFLKSREMFGGRAQDLRTILRNLDGSDDTKNDSEAAEDADRIGKTLRPRFLLLRRLRVPGDFWGSLANLNQVEGKKGEERFVWSQLSTGERFVPGLIPDIFNISRAKAEQFSPVHPHHHSVAIKPTEVVIPVDSEDERDAADGGGDNGQATNENQKKEAMVVQVRPKEEPTEEPVEEPTEEPVKE